MNNSTPAMPPFSLQINPITIPPPASTKAQWDTINSYIDKLSSDGLPTIDRIILDNFNISVLAAVLAKKRSQLDVLYSEPKSPVAASSPRRHMKRNSILSFPDYDIGTRVSRHRRTAAIDNTPPLSLSIPPDTPPVSLSRGSSPHRPQRNALNELVYSQRTFRVGSSSGFAPAHTPDVSPLSPTFGPRQGEIPSGTLQRRRASLPMNQLDPSACPAYKRSKDDTSHITEAIRHSKESMVDCNTGREKKILWEAAWKEIEGNFEEYVGLFVRDDDVSCNEKQSLWEQILDVSAKIREIEMSRGR